MLKIGLTGGIGSGKTVVAGIFKVLGIPVFNADYEARRIMETDLELIQNISNEFGEESYKEGKLNRLYLSGIVFNDPNKLERLNALVHPVTIDTAGQWMKNQTSAYVVKEAALLFEAGSAEHLDYVIGVHAPQSLRIQRVMHRDNISREAVLAKMDKQLSETIKMKLCDFVVVNDEQQLLVPQVLHLHSKFLSLTVVSSL